MITYQKKTMATKNTLKRTAKTIALKAVTTKIRAKSAKLTREQTTKKTRKSSLGATSKTRVVVSRRTVAPQKPLPKIFVNDTMFPQLPTNLLSASFVRALPLPTLVSNTATYVEWPKSIPFLGTIHSKEVLKPHSITPKHQRDDGPSASLASISVDDKGRIIAGNDVDVLVRTFPRSQTAGFRADVEFHQHLANCAHVPQLLFHGLTVTSANMEARDNAIGAIVLHVGEGSEPGGSRQVWTKRECALVMAAFDEIHARGVVHGKPFSNNILFDASGKVWVIGFQEAKALRGGMNGRSRTFFSREVFSRDEFERLAEEERASVERMCADKILGI
ncbi:hypothetical protein HK101_000607 [Irineochytrium annulatum]|nr:hypothetical protein HK101_000607 [Irineochytrium annulatum]